MLLLESFVPPVQYRDSRLRVECELKPWCFNKLMLRIMFGIHKPIAAHGSLPALPWRNFTICMCCSKMEICLNGVCTSFWQAVGLTHGCSESLEYGLRKMCTRARCPSWQQGRDPCVPYLTCKRWKQRPECSSKAFRDHYFQYVKCRGLPSLRFQPASIINSGRVAREEVCCENVPNEIVHVVLPECIQWWKCTSYVNVSRSHSLLACVFLVM